MSLQSLDTAEAIGSKPAHDQDLKLAATCLLLPVGWVFCQWLDPKNKGSMP